MILLGSFKIDPSGIFSSTAAIVLTSSCYCKDCWVGLSSVVPQCHTNKLCKEEALRGYGRAHSCPDQLLGKTVEHVLHLWQANQ